MFRTLTSQEWRWGSKTPEKPSFFEAENDLVRRSSGKKVVLDFVVGFEVSMLVAEDDGTLKMALRAAAAVEEEVDGLREEEAAVAAD